MRRHSGSTVSPRGADSNGRHASRRSSPRSPERLLPLERYQVFRLRALTRVPGAAVGVVPDAHRPMEPYPLARSDPRLCAGCGSASPAPYLHPYGRTDVRPKEAIDMAALMDHEHPVDPERVARARAHVLAAEDAALLASLLSLMADPVRSRLLDALDLVEELCVGDLALVLGITEDAVGYGLRILRTAGLVQTRQGGPGRVLPAGHRLPRTAARALPAPAGRAVTRRRRHRGGRVTDRAAVHDHPGAGHGAAHHDEHDHGHDHGSHADMFRRLFWINLALTLPVVVYSPHDPGLVRLRAPSSRDPARSPRCSAATSSSRRSGLPDGRMGRAAPAVSPG